MINFAAQNNKVNLLFADYYYGKSTALAGENKRYAII